MGSAGTRFLIIPFERFQDPVPERRAIEHEEQEDYSIGRCHANCFY